MAMYACQVLCIIKMLPPDSSAGSICLVCISAESKSHRQIDLSLVIGVFYLSVASHIPLARAGIANTIS